jgi:hypothetical protein
MFSTHLLSTTMPLANKLTTIVALKRKGTMTYTEQQMYRQEVLHLPGPVDRWLIANIRSPRINFLQNYLMFEEGYGYVACSVEIESEEVSSLSTSTRALISCIIQLPSTNPFAERLTKYTLYVEAVASPRSKLHLHLRKSPRAILERFTGLNTAIDAPDWTSWERKTWEFQQPQLDFASLFVRMASWKENQNQVCFAHIHHLQMLTKILQPGLSYQMSLWAKSMTASTPFADTFEC